jgi:hypothetical protein
VHCITRGDRHDEPRGSFDLPRHIRYPRQRVLSQALPIGPVWLKIDPLEGDNPKYDLGVVWCLYGPPVALSRELEEVVFRHPQAH